MPDRHACDYAFVRVVPRVEREEFINVGVILFCRPRRFLEARIALDRSRLAALSAASELDIEMLQTQLDMLPLVARGGRTAGPIGELPQADRWHWLVSPRSTIIQVSPAHCVLCDDPAAALDRLMRLVV